MSARESVTMEALKKKMIEIKGANILPRGYGEIIAENLGVDRNRIYQTLLGKTADLNIMEAVIDIAIENKKKRLAAGIAKSPKTDEEIVKIIIEEREKGQSYRKIAKTLELNFGISWSSATIQRRVVNSKK